MHMSVTHAAHASKVVPDASAYYCWQAVDATGQHLCLLKLELQPQLLIVVDLLQAWCIII